MTEPVFVDECGYTGPDLFNEEQPVFTLAAINYSEAECADLKRKFFSKVSASELKYKELRKIPKHQSAIIEFLTAFSKNPNRFRAVYIHKRFALTCQMVNHIIEPVMHMAGINLYERGANIGMSNLIHLAIPQIAGHEFANNLLRRFQDMVRTPSTVTISMFGKSLVPNSANPTLRKILELASRPFSQIPHEYLMHLEGADLNIEFSSTLLLISQLAELLRKPLDVIHDESSRMANEKALWDAMTSPTIPPAFVGFDRRTMKFPIGVEKTRLMRSMDMAGLQLADVVAGSLCHVCKSKIRLHAGESLSSFEQLLTEIVDDWVTEGQIWPRAEFTPEELDTEGELYADPIAHTQAIMSRIAKT